MGVFPNGRGVFPQSYLTHLIFPELNSEGSLVYPQGLFRLTHMTFECLNCLADMLSFYINKSLHAFSV